VSHIRDILCLRLSPRVQTLGCYSVVTMATFFFRLLSYLTKRGNTPVNEAVGTDRWGLLKSHKLPLLSSASFFLVFCIRLFYPTFRFVRLNSWLPYRLSILESNDNKSRFVYMYIYLGVHEREKRDRERKRENRGADVYIFRLYSLIQEVPLVPPVVNCQSWGLGGVGVMMSFWLWTFISLK
jgi:hypothetical protein